MRTSIRQKTLLSAFVLILGTVSPGSKAAPSWRCFFGDQYEKRACTFLQDLSHKVDESSDPWLGQFKGYTTCAFGSLEGWKTIQNALGKPIEKIGDRYTVGASKVIHDGPHRYGEDYFGNIRQEIAQMDIVDRKTGDLKMVIRVSCETWRDGGVKRKSCDIANIAADDLSPPLSARNICQGLLVPGLND